VRFRLEVDKLIEETLNLEYTILQNTPSSIVAAYVFVGFDDPPPGAISVVIDKRTGDFRRSNAILGKANDAARHGSCING
jgi:hypothetical protein